MLGAKVREEPGIRRRRGPGGALEIGFFYYSKKI